MGLWAALARRCAAPCPACGLCPTLPADPRCVPPSLPPLPPALCQVNPKHLSVFERFVLRYGRGYNADAPDVPPLPPLSARTVKAAPSDGAQA